MDVRDPVGRDPVSAGIGALIRWQDDCQRQAHQQIRSPLIQVTELFELGGGCAAPGPAGQARSAVRRSSTSISQNSSGQPAETSAQRASTSLAVTLILAAIAYRRRPGSARRRCAAAGPARAPARTDLGRPRKLAFALAVLVQPDLGKRKVVLDRARLVPSRSSHPEGRPQKRERAIAAVSAS